MERRGMINIGFGNFVPSERIVAVVSPDGSPMRRLRAEAKEAQRLIDATQGRRTRSIVILDSNHLVLSHVLAETVAQRYLLAGPKGEDED